jgi:type I restriction enzyme M protein
LDINKLRWSAKIGSGCSGALIFPTLGKTKLKSAYDPTSGSGSLLLRISKEAEVNNFYGQELNRTTYNLCRMNMILHNVHYRRFDIRQEDTLEHL